MSTIKERITITPDSEKDVKQIKILANLTKVTHSKLGAWIISEWLKTNFQKELEEHYQTLSLYKKLNIIDEDLDINSVMKYTKVRKRWTKKNQKQVDVNLTIKGNYGLFLMVKNGSKSILKNITANLKMKLSDYQKKFIAFKLRWGIKEIEGRLKERKRQWDEKELIHWSERTLLVAIKKGNKEIEELKELANYFNLDLNKY